MESLEETQWCPQDEKRIKRHDLEFFLSDELITFTAGGIQKKETHTRAVHAWVSNQQTATACSVFQKLCPTKPQDVCVMGVMWTFMIHPENTLAPISLLAALCAEEMLDV